MIVAPSILTQKRLKGELLNLEKNREAYYQVIQDELDMFKFYFLIRGDTTSSYKGGYYIGEIALPTDYPLSPGNFKMYTPSGRFNIGTNICLTNSGFHKESWSAVWSIERMVVGFVSVFGTDETTGVAHIKDTPQNRVHMANNSAAYNRTNHLKIFKRFNQYVKEDGSLKTDAEIKEFIEQSKPVKGNKEKKNKKDAEIKEEVKEPINVASNEEIKEDIKEPINVASNEEIKEDIKEPINVASNEEIKEEIKETIKDPVENAKTDERIEEIMNEIRSEIKDKTNKSKKDESKKDESKKRSSIKVIGKSTLAKKPKNYDEWMKYVKGCTVETFNAEIFAMRF